MRNKNVSPFVQDVLQNRKAEAVTQVERRYKKNVDEANNEALDDLVVQAVIRAQEQLEKTKKEAKKAGYELDKWDDKMKATREIARLRTEANRLQVRIGKEFESTM